MPATTHPYNVGDVLVSSWGYDQTNIDFYIVLKVTPRTVTLRELNKEVVRRTDSSEHVAPVLGSYASEHTLKGRRPSACGMVNVGTNFTQYARKWDGTPRYQTAFGFGH